VAGNSNWPVARQLVTCKSLHEEHAVEGLASACSSESGDIMLNPQSQQAIDTLLAGVALGSGDSTVGPLDVQPQTLLKVIVDNLATLQPPLPTRGDYISSCANPSVV
jgi:hypothetical protein